MNNIQLNIIANAQFQQVYAEVAKLKEAMLSLQKASVGGPFTPSTVAGIKQAQSAFDNAILSTRAFNIETVAMGSNIEKFGKQLQAGKLSINQYYKIWRDNTKSVSTELDNLATSQARLNRSIAIADPLRPGYAKLVTDINGVVTAQEKAIFYQQALNTALNQGATKLIDFGKNMQWAGRQMTVGLTVPLALFAKQAAQSYLSFDQQMTDMLKVYGSHAVVQSQQALDTIKTQVTSLADNLAHTIGVTMTDTVTIAKTFSAIGLEGQDLIKTTSATATLMKLGGMSATDSANAMVTLQNVFKIQSNQMQDAVNFLNAAKHSTSTTMQDIIDAIPRVGPILQQMGGTYKDFVTLLVALRENGVPAAQGANAIKSMFASLDNPTSKAISMFNSLGISLKGIVAKDQNNPLQMVLDLSSALDKLPSLTRQQAIEQLFGKFQFARVEALLNSIGKAGSQNAKVLELYNQSNDQLAAVAKQEIDISSNKTPAAQYNKMKASLQADLIPLGQTFLQVMTKLGNIVDGIVKGFNHLGTAGKILIGALSFIGILGPIIMLTGLLSNLVGQILKGANYMRMFKEGMDNASPSQNKFLAGIHNLNNFYQDLDKSTIAARNQLDLMPEAITSNAQAFEILRKSIADLTQQFLALTAAQREAMGGTLVSGTLNSALGAAATELQMRLPGFAFGGIVPGTGNKDSYAAMLTPGETVITKEKSRRYSTVLSQILNDTLPGYNGGTPKGVFGLQTPEGSSEAIAVPIQKLHIFESVTGRLLDSLTSVYENIIGPNRRLENIQKYDLGAVMGGTATLNQITRGGAKGGTPEEVLQELRLYPQLKGTTGAALDPMALMKQVADKIVPPAQLQETYNKLDQAYQDLIARVEAMTRDPNLAGKRVIGSNAGQTSFEALAAQAVEGQLGGTTTNISSSRGRRLSFTEVLRSVATPRGGMIRRRGTPQQEEHQSTGEVFNRDIETGEFSAYRSSSLKAAGIPMSAVSTASGAVPFGMKYTEAETSASNLGKRLIKRVRTAVRANSDSQEAIAVAKDIDSGLAHGMTQNIPMVESAAKKTATVVQEELDLALPKIEESGAALGAGAGQSIIGAVEKELGSGVSGNRISNAFSKMGSKFSGLGMMGRMGLGTGMMMAGSMAGSMIGGTTGSAIGNVSNFASMGMMFGGYGAAIGAAIGGLKTVFDYMHKQAQATAQEWKNVTTTSASDLQIFGSTALNTSIQTHNLAIQTTSSAGAAKDAATAMAGLTTQFGALAPAVQSMIAAIKNLPKGDPLGDMVKEMSDTSYKTSGLIGNIQKNVANAISTGGLDPKQAKQYVYSLFAATGRTSDFAAGWKEISKNLGYDPKTGLASSSAATATSISKIVGQDKNFQQSYFDRTGRGMTAMNYKDLSGGAKALADQMKNLYAITSNGSLSLSQMQERLKGVATSGQDTGTALVALEQAIIGTGSSDDIKRLHQVEGIIKDSGPNAKLSASEIMKMNAVLQVMTPDQLKKWADANGKKLGLTAASKMGAIIDAYAKSGDFKKAIDEANKAVTAGLGGTDTGGTNAGGTSAAGVDSKLYDATIKRYTDMSKVLTQQANAQKKYNDQLKLTSDYLAKQNSYLEQAKQAFASGDYLAAAQVQQSSQYAKSEYVGQMQQNKLSDQQQQLQDIIDALQSGKAAGNISLASTLGDISKQMGYKVGSSPSSSFIQSMTGYATVDKGLAAAAALSQKGSALTTSAIKATSGGDYAGAQIVNNFDFSNSLVSDPNALITQVSNASVAAMEKSLQKAGAKGNGGHKVNTPTKDNKRASKIK